MLRSLVQKLAPISISPLRCVTPVIPVLRNFHFFTRPNQLPKTIQGADAQLLLRPSVPLVEQVAGFKVKGRLKRRCKDCYFVMRQERLYVICKTHPRHKQMAMQKRDYKSWILTHATQSKVRPY